MPSVPVGSLQPWKDYSWVSHQEQPFLPRWNSREKRRMPVKQSWQSCPIRASATSQPYFTLSTSTRCNSEIIHYQLVDKCQLVNKHWENRHNGNSSACFISANKLSTLSSPTESRIELSLTSICSRCSREKVPYMVLAGCMISDRLSKRFVARRINFSRLRKRNHCFLEARSKSNM